MIRFLDIANHTLFWYYLASNVAYLVMLLVALKTSATHQRNLESYRLNWITDAPMAPPITVIAPAHNEESSIRVAVRNLLALDYPHLELIVVNDGSVDRTLQELVWRLSGGWFANLLDEQYFVWESDVWCSIDD